MKWLLTIGWPSIAVMRSSICNVMKAVWLVLCDPAYFVSDWLFDYILFICYFQCLFWYGTVTVLMSMIFRKVFLMTLTIRWYSMIFFILGIATIIHSISDAISDYSVQWYDYSVFYCVCDSSWYDYWFQKAILAPDDCWSILNVVWPMTEVIILLFIDEYYSGSHSVHLCYSVDIPWTYSVIIHCSIHCSYILLWSIVVVCAVIPDDYDPSMTDIQSLCEMTMMTILQYNLSTVIWWLISIILIE